MPSSPSLARLLMAALLATLMIAGPALAGGLLPSLAPAASAATDSQVTAAPGTVAAPAAPGDGEGSDDQGSDDDADADDAPVSLDLVSLDPTSLAPGGTLTAVVAVTNTSSEPVDAAALELRARSSRVTDRTTIAEWQAATEPDAVGEPVATSASTRSIAPGATVQLTVSADADDLGFSTESYYWGTRRISLTVTTGGSGSAVSDDGTDGTAADGDGDGADGGDGEAVQGEVVRGEPVASLRTFVVWRPEGASDTIAQSVLLPMASSDPGAAVVDAEAMASSAESGQLATVRALAQRTDVDWWLDPALLDPPATAQGTETTDDGAEDGDAAADDDATGDDGDTTGDDGTTGTVGADDTGDAGDAGGADSTDDSTSGEEGEEESADSDAPPAPPTVYAEDELSAQIADELVSAAGDRTILSMPYAQADVEGLGSAGADDLLTVLTERADATWESTGVSPQLTALSVDGSAADADALETAADAGAEAVIVPSASIRTDLASTVTPSSVALYQGSGASEAGALTLLTPDSALSAELSSLTTGSDAELTTQRMLAETATIASEYTTADRHLLISPPTLEGLDASAVGAALDALGEAPWITAGSTSDLLDAAESGALTTDTRSEDDDLYGTGEITPDEVQPSSVDASGLAEHLEVSEGTGLAEHVDAQLVHRVQATWSRADLLASTMEDDVSLEPLRLELLSAVSSQLLDQPESASDRADDADARTTTMLDSLHVVPASGYNLISDAAGVPITVTNELDSPVTVRIAVESDRPLVQVTDQPVVTVPARGRVETTVPVEAIANGTVTLTTRLTTEDGTSLTDAVEVPLNVNPAWENWTTMLLVVAMGTLVVVGVLRARRVGASTRAPAVHGPEDPVELSRTGISQPVCPEHEDRDDESPEERS